MMDIFAKHYVTTDNDDNDDNLAAKEVIPLRSTPTVPIPSKGCVELGAQSASKDRTHIQPLKSRYHYIIKALNISRESKRVNQRSRANSECIEENTHAKECRELS